VGEGDGLMVGVVVGEALVGVLDGDTEGITVG